jgi:hypothetical protein
MDGVLRKPVLLADLLRVTQMWLSEHFSSVSFAESATSAIATGAGSPTFWEATEKDLELLNIAANENDIGQIKRIAHRIYGAAMVVREDRIARASRATFDLADSSHVERGRIDESVRRLTELARTGRKKR